MPIPNNAESPLKRYFDAFDVENIDLTASQYKKHAIQQDMNLTQMMTDDWIWRAEHKQNVIASAEGEQGSGKSLFLSAGAIICSNIFKVPFYSKTDENVLRDHLSFDSEIMDQQLDRGGQKETYLNDEHRKNKVGIMSNMVEASLEEKEDQLRKHQINMFFASPELQDHKHFFVFEMKHISFGNDGFPVSTVAMLKTRRYTDRNEFVWRGYVSFPVPPKEYLNQYDPLKDEHLLRLKEKYGNTLDPVVFYANKLFKENHDELITKSKEGFIKPIKAEIMYFVIAKELGTRKFTTTGYSLLQARLKQMIIEAYAKENEKLQEQLLLEAEALKQERQAKHEELLKEAEKRREEKIKALEMRLEAEEKKQELKARALELKEKQFELRKSKIEKVSK